MQSPHTNRKFRVIAVFLASALGATIGASVVNSAQRQGQSGSIPAPNASSTPAASPTAAQAGPQKTSGAASGEKTDKKPWEWKPVFDIALGLIGLISGIIAIFRLQSDRSAQQQAAQADSSVNVLRITSGSLPELSVKKPLIKYLWLGSQGTYTLLLSLAAVALVYGVRQERAYAEGDLYRIGSEELQQESQVAKTTEELNHPVSDEVKAAMEKELEQEREKLKAITTVRKRWEDELAASGIYLVVYQISFFAAAAFFFVFGLLRIRTFTLWLRSHPRDPSCPSAAYQKVEISTSLALDYAIARSLTAVKKTGARIVELNAEARPCSLWAVRHYKGRNSFFEDIRIQVTEDKNGSTIGISVDGLRPTLRSDIMRNQLTLNALINHVTS